MPAPTNKRVKNTRIERKFLIGSESWLLTPENRPKGIPEVHTKGWRIYVRNVDEGPDLNSWLQKVQFKLHSDYQPQNRMVETSVVAGGIGGGKAGGQSFQVEETGWGEFQVGVRLYFVAEAHEKPQERTCWLQLEPWGSDAQKEEQKRTGRINMEYGEVIEFNEPTEALFERLTSEAQFDYLSVRKKGGKGKGSVRANLGPVPQGSAEMPEKATGVFSREAEDGVLGLLENAKRQAEDALKEVSLEREKIAEQKKGL